MRLAVSLWCFSFACVPSHPLPPAPVPVSLDRGELTWGAPVEGRFAAELETHRYALAAGGPSSFSLELSASDGAAELSAELVAVGGEGELQQPLVTGSAAGKLELTGDLVTTAGLYAVLVRAAPGVEYSLAARCVTGTCETVRTLETYDVSALNADLTAGAPMVDVELHMTEGGPFPWPSMEAVVRKAKAVFQLAGLQLRVVRARKLALPRRWQSLVLDKVSDLENPKLADDDIYAYAEAAKPTLTPAATEILTSLIGASAANARTIHVVALSSVRFTVHHPDSSGVYQPTVLASGAFSLPPYWYAERIPRHLRGVITVTDDRGLNPEAPPKVLAHELGHKLINVDHEGVNRCPLHINAGGPNDLMLYGSGTRIPEGRAGRWQLERLALSPFIYRRPEGGAATYNPEYQHGGIYRDALYGPYALTPTCPPMEDAEILAVTDVPGKVQAEHYAPGGEGVGYHDTDSANYGSVYRKEEGVDLQATDDDGGGYHVGWISDGEWLAYTLNVPAAGQYVVSLRVGAPDPGTSAKLEYAADQAPLAITIPATGSYQAWADVAFPAVALEAGKVQVKLHFAAQPGTVPRFAHFNHFTVTAAP